MSIVSRPLRVNNSQSNVSYEVFAGLYSKQEVFTFATPLISNLLSLIFQPPMLYLIRFPIKMGVSVLNIIAAIASLMIIVILTTVLQQVLFKNSNEPPLVFHWLPVIGSTVTYGIDPFKFFFDCQKKVGKLPPDFDILQGFLREMLTLIKSTAMSIHSYSWAEK